MCMCECVCMCVCVCVCVWMRVDSQRLLRSRYHGAHAAHKGVPQQCGWPWCRTRDGPATVGGYREEGALTACLSHCSRPTSQCPGRMQTPDRTCTCTPAHTTATEDPRFTQESGGSVRHTSSVGKGSLHGSSARIRRWMVRQWGMV